MPYESTHSVDDGYAGPQVRESPEDGYYVVPCYYCGLVAESVDHVVPQSLLESLRILGDNETSRQLERRHRVKVVPACKECNCLIGAKYFPTLDERKRWLKGRLRRRYKKALETPNWTDAELMQLSPGLRGYVMQGIEDAAVIRKRLAF